MLLPFGLGMLAYGIWLAGVSLAAAAAAIDLARAPDCDRGVARGDCVAERFGRVVSGRVDYNRRFPDDFYVTIDFADGSRQEVQIAYESDWLELPDGQRVWLRSLGRRPLEVIAPGRERAMAAQHPTYSGMNAALEAPLFLTLGIATPFVFLALERRRRLPLCSFEGAHARLVSVLALLVAGLCILSLPSLVFNLRPPMIAGTVLVVAAVMVGLGLRTRVSARA